MISIKQQEGGKGSKKSRTRINWLPDYGSVHILFFNVPVGKHSTFFTSSLKPFSRFDQNLTFISLLTIISIKINSNIHIFFINLEPNSEVQNFKSSRVRTPLKLLHILPEVCKNFKNFRSSNIVHLINSINCDNVLNTN